MVLPLVVEALLYIHRKTNSIDDWIACGDVVDDSPQTLPILHTTRVRFPYGLRHECPHARRIDNALRTISKEGENH